MTFEEAKRHVENNRARLAIIHLSRDELEVFSALILEIESLQRKVNSVSDRQGMEAALSGGRFD